MMTPNRCVIIWLVQAVQSNANTYAKIQRQRYGARDKGSLPAQ